MKIGKSRLFALAAAHGASLLTVPAVLQAQAQAQAPSGQLEEIIVTARQREERIEDVPVSITAFTASEIRSAGIERPTDFIALTPGVSQVQTAEAGDLQVNIRGINTGRDAETNFALVIDGVLQTNPNALNQELSGVTQIEVLKGPQGALYGRNALAGALILTTRKPTDEWASEVTAGYGSDNSYKGSVYFGGPLGEALRGAVSAYTRHTDGQWENLKNDCDDCVDKFEETGFAGRLLFELGGGEMDFKAKYSELESGAINFNGSVALPDAAAFLGIPALYEDPNDHNFRYINNINPQNEQENLNLSLKGDWDVGFATLTGYVAWNDQTNFFLTDGASDAFFLYAFDDTCRVTNDSNLTDPGYEAPFFGVPSNLWFTPEGGGAAGFLPPYGPSTCGGYQYQQRDQEDLSVELRLTSPGDQRLRWVGGVYFADIDRHVVVSQGSDQQQGFRTTGFVPASGPNPTDLLYDDDFSSKVYAVFGQVAYDVVDNLELALALRYDSEDREVSNNVPTCADGGDRCFAQTPNFGAGWGFLVPLPYYINPAYQTDPALATSGIPNRSETFEQLQPKVSLNWNLTDGFALFASYGYGFRSGGFNSSGSSATADVWYGALTLDDGTQNLSEVSDQYDKEVSKAAELGFKSYFLDRSVSLNAALYHTTVEDMQFFNFFAGPFGLLRVVTNIDEVTIQGAEIDARWQINEMFTVFAGYGITDGNIDKYSGRPYTKGNEVPYAPEYTGNIGAEATFPVTESLELIARIDGTFVGETWFHPVQEERLPNLFGYFGFGQGEFSKQVRDPYAVFNARLTLQGANWGVTAWGRNISDEDYLAEIIPAPEFGGSFVHDAPGDSYGVDLSYRF
ncbi:MAG TPA: TonB-dependent receptor [Steroidobacteraceae bacterium]|nr:TonB-dependent receptor [Steroidobacteraceae bacterium]